MRNVIGLSILILALAAAACGNKKDEAKPGQGKSYKVRGVIDKPAAGGVVYIHHEAVPDFTNAFGESKTMASMKMGFGVGGTNADQLAAGDKVSFTFVTDWNAKPAIQLTAIEKLPADTELTLE